MSEQNFHKAFSQRQLRVGELVKQNLGELLIKNEAKIPSINSKLITVTEVRMTPDLKTARVYVIPLGGVDTKEVVRILTEYSHLVRKALSKRLDIKFLPKLTFVEDNSFEYAEKIEKIIKKNKENDKEIAEKSSQYLNNEMSKANYVEIKEVIAKLVQQETQKLALLEANDFYVFEYIDPPAVMEIKSEPQRSIICILGALIGGLIGTFIVLFRFFKD